MAYTSPPKSNAARAGVTDSARARLPRAKPKRGGSRPNINPTPYGVETDADRRSDITSARMRAIAARYEGQARQSNRGRTPSSSGGSGGGLGSALGEGVGRRLRTSGPMSAASRASAARYTGQTQAAYNKMLNGVSDADLFGALAQGGMGGGVDPTAMGIADMIAGSVPAPPQIDIAGALNPYDQATWQVVDQAKTALETLKGIDAERGVARQQNAAAGDARLRELAQRTAAGIEQMDATAAADARYGAGDLAAQGVDAGYAQAQAQARNQSNAGIAGAQNSNVDFERAMADRAAASAASEDRALDQGSRANLTGNKADALREIATARATTEAQLRQAQAQLEAQFAQDQVGANIDAAKYAAEAASAGGDPLDLQRTAMEMLSGLPNGGRTFPKRQGVEQLLAQYDPKGTKEADDLFNLVASQAVDRQDFNAVLEEALAANNAARQEGGGKPRNWDRKWFRELADQWFETGGIEATAANDILRYLLGGGGGAPFTGLPTGATRNRGAS